MDVKETSRLSEGQESVSLVSVLHCTHDVESIKCMVLRPPECDPSIQGKNKKKKKKAKNMHTPKRLIDFNTSELLKLDKEKSVSEKCAVKQLSSSTFVVRNCIVESNCVVSKGEKESGDSKDFTEHLMQKLPPNLVAPHKSALRGAYEELGFGARPKLHVKWAPSVWEPPSSIVSHTVNNNKPKNKHSRKNLKQGHKGKHGRKKDDNNKQHLTPRRNPMKDECRQDETCEQVGARVASKVLSRFDTKELQNNELDRHIDDEPETYGCCDAPDREPVLFSEKWCSSRQLQVQ